MLVRSKCPIANKEVEALPLGENEQAPSLVHQVASRLGVPQAGRMPVSQVFFFRTDAPSLTRATLRYTNSRVCGRDHNLA